MVKPFGPPPDAPDAELVRRARLGDFRAFDILAGRYRSVAVSVARKNCGSPDLAEDAVQDGLLMAFKNLPQLDDDERFAPWLCAIVRHRARRLARQDGRHATRELSDVDRFLLQKCHALARSSETARFDREQADLTIEAIQALPAMYAEPLRLYYGAARSVDEIAQELDLPKTTVKWRLHAGRKLVQERLQDQETTP